MGPYRRVFVFTHPSMEAEPLVVLHVALTNEVFRSMFNTNPDPTVCPRILDLFILVSYYKNVSWTYSNLKRFWSNRFHFWTQFSTSKVRISSPNYNDCMVTNNNTQRMSSGFLFLLIQHYSGHWGLGCGWLWVIQYSDASLQSGMFAKQIEFIYMLEV